MRIGLLHLSDIHFTADATNNGALLRTQAVAAAVKHDLHPCTDVFVILTGDIAQSGSAAEYTVADKWLQAMRDSLEAEGLSVNSIVAVPGNHDCDFTGPTGVRSALLDSVTKTSPSSDIVSECVKIQATYRSFQDRNGLLGIGDCVHTRHEVAVGQGKDRQVVFHLFNSSWMSSIKEKPGSLVAPVDLLRLEEAPTTVVGNRPPEVVIWMMHHPYEWFDPTNGRRLRDHVENASDVVLTGHQHEPGSYSRTSANASVDYIEGGVLQEGAKSSQSSFNVVLIDIVACTYSTRSYAFDGSLYVRPEEAAWRPFSRNVRRNHGVIDFNPTFKAQLNDAGAGFTHPHKSPLELTDIFVYPDVRDLPMSGAKEGQVIKDLPDYLLQRKRIAFIGEEKSGKSTLARWLCSTLREKGLLPVLAQGDRFTPKNVDSMRSAIKKLVRDQYNSGVDERFVQLPATGKVLLIDDFQRLGMSRTSTAVVLEGIEVFFEYVVLFCGDDLRMGYLTQSPNELSEHPIFEYSFAEILQLGFVKRHELVQRWYQVGRPSDHGFELETIHREVVAAENMLSGLIGRNLVPSYPLIVLILLQNIEAGRPLDTGAGSQGYLYQTLIVTALSRISGRNRDIDGRMSYLTEFAWRQFQPVQQDRIDLEEVRRWHMAYCERHLVDYAYPRFMEDLCSVGVLRQERGEVGFAYPYIRYFFVARYLQKHLHEDEVREMVRSYVSRLHEERIATIMVFLTHLSSEPFVIDLMLDAAAHLFEGELEWDPKAQAQAFNKLIERTPELVLSAKSVEDNRKEELEERDAEDHESRLGDAKEESEEFEREMSVLLQVNSSFKTIQIVGQILRNYPGSLDGRRKVELTEACFRLGFRMLHFFFAVVDAHGDEFVEALVHYVAKGRPEVKRDRIALDANQVLFGLAERVAFTIVRHLSQSVGHEDLSPVYKELEKIGAGATPFRLVDLSLKLDHNAQFPATDATRLYKDERSNMLVATLVRHLVWYHLYLFPTDYKLRQSICTQLEIKQSIGLLTNQQKMLSADRKK